MKRNFNSAEIAELVDIFCDPVLVQWQTLMDEVFKTLTVSPSLDISSDKALDDSIDKIIDRAYMAMPAYDDFMEFYGWEPGRPNKTFKKWLIKTSVQNPNAFDEIVKRVKEINDSFYSCRCIILPITPV
jgi:hypothetical protein